LLLQIIHFSVIERLTFVERLSLKKKRSELKTTAG